MRFLRRGQFALALDLTHGFQPFSVGRVASVVAERLDGDVRDHDCDASVRFSIWNHEHSLISCCRFSAAARQSHANTTTLPLMATSTFQPSSLLPTTFAVLSICLSGALGASRWGESVHKPVCESNKLVCFFSARYKKPGSRPGSLGSPLGEKRG